MRPKVILLALLAFCTGACLLTLLKDRSGPNSPGTVPAQAEADSAGASSNSPPPAAGPPPPGSDAATNKPSSVPGDEAQRIRLVETASAELDALVERGGPVALDAILDRLNHPEREVRQAALEALLRLDNRAAIPRMRQAAERLEDAEEKKALLEAAEFLALPSPSEVPAAERSPAGRTRVTKKPARPGVGTGTP